MSEAPGRMLDPENPKVFICYRREDTAAHAGRLYDAMVARFGERNVFMDVDMAPGVDFVERITQVVSGCLVLIVVMGRNWATAKDEDGGTRIADPSDFVRVEVETGLGHSEVTPIPVLVSGARMPRPEELPAELGPITRRNALELSDARWSYDVGRLMSTLDELLAHIDGGAPVAPPAEAPRPTPSSRPTVPTERLLLEGVLVAGITASAASWLGKTLINGPDKPFEQTALAIASVVGRQAETWALVGVALALWLATRTGRPDLFRLATIGLLVGAIAGAIGGALFAVPYYLLGTDPRSVTGLERIEAKDELTMLRHWGNLASFAVTGGFFGALIGGLWRPPRLAAALIAGTLGGALFQLLFVVATGWNIAPVPTLGLVAAVIAAFTLGTLLALDRTRSVSTPSVGARSPQSG